MGLDKVKDFLSEYHVIVKDDWVTQAVYVCKDYGCNSSLKQLCASVLDLFLNSDLLESYVAPMKIPSIAVKLVITKPIIFQITSAFDISRPLYEQFNEASFHKDDLSWFNGDDHDNDVVDSSHSVNSRKRILKLALFDGTNMISGLEFGTLKCVPSDVRLGAKIILTARVVCRKGVMLLNDSNCQLLGGDIDQWNPTVDPAQKFADRLGIEFVNGRRAPSLKAPDAFAPAGLKSKSTKAADVSNASSNGNSTLSPFLVKMPRRVEQTDPNTTSCSEAGLVQQPLRLKEYPLANRIPVKSTNPFDKTTELSSCSALVSSLGSPETHEKSSLSDISSLGKPASEIFQSCSKQKLIRKDITEQVNSKHSGLKPLRHKAEESMMKTPEKIVLPRPQAPARPIEKADFVQKKYDSYSSLQPKPLQPKVHPPPVYHTDTSSNVTPQDSIPSCNPIPSPKNSTTVGVAYKQFNMVQPSKTTSEREPRKVVDCSNLPNRKASIIPDHNNNSTNSTFESSNRDISHSSTLRHTLPISADSTKLDSHSFIPTIAFQNQLRLPPLTRPPPPTHHKLTLGSPRKADMGNVSKTFDVPEKRIRTDTPPVAPSLAVRELQTTRVFSDDETDKSIALQDTLSDLKISMIDKFKRLNIVLLSSALRNKAYWMLPKVVLIQGLCHVPTDLKARNGHWVLHIHVSDESTERLYCEVSPILLDQMLGFTVQSCQDPIVIGNKAEMQRRKSRALSVAHSLLRLDLILSIELYPERDSTPLILDVKTISETLNIIN